MEYEQGDIVLCQVTKIIGTTVFVDIEGINKQGSIVMSEIAPGRIRNLREYVVPKKTIVCKILEIKDDQVELSLRRVKEKERKEMLQQVKLEKSYKSIIKSILKEKTKEVIEKIKKTHRINQFLQQAKENPQILYEIIDKENADKIIKILKNQKEKTVQLKKTIQLTTQEPNGLSIIKQILSDQKDVKIKYIAAGKYSISREDTSLKQADTKIKQLAKEMEKKANSLNAHFKLI